MKTVSPGLNCTYPDIEEYPDIFTFEAPNIYIILIALLICLYCFTATAVMCDGYFVPALEYLCYRFKLRHDVVGATIMAAGTSAPEFFVNVIGTLVTHGDTGVGTILGSSFFNCLGIPACCALFVPKKVILEWWPLTRDVLWYFASIVVVSIILYNQEISSSEVIFMLGMYVLNCVNMVFDNRLRKLCSVKSESQIVPVEPEQHAPEEQEKEEPPNMLYTSIHFPYQGSRLTKIFWIFAWPILLIFFITIPNCRENSAKKLFFLSIIMCIVWLSLTSYVATWMITVLGHNWFIPESVMGLTLLSIGTSVPEIFTSVIVARKGYGSMAICGAISSNTYNILLCLGVPWALHFVIRFDNVRTGDIVPESAGMGFISLSLMIKVILFYTSLLIAHFVLTPQLGILYAVAYVVFISLSCLIEFDIFGNIHLPECEK